MSVIHRLRNNRWLWLIKGLPSLARARALFAVKRYTMTTPERCRHLWDICLQTLEKGVPGSFVECGVWKGGSSGVMSLAMQHAGQQRDLHLFDSFEGLPEPTEKDGELASVYSGGRSSGALESVGQCRAGLNEVEDFLLTRLHVPRSNLHFHVGWFQNTVPRDAGQLGPIAILRLDGDWYESTRICLENLYPLISPGGVIILDDYYCWEGCAKATDEYRQLHGIEPPIQ
ncbi:MAG: hypothetical protein EOP84_16045, partial [Verrucomicrobiaceae bacterium]